MNDESLFGDMTLDSNLHREMEMDMMGGDGDDDDDDDVVFSINTSPNSSDTDLDDDDDVAKATIPPKSLENFSSGTGTSASFVSSMSMPGMGAVCPGRCSKGCPIKDDRGPSICH